MTYAITYDLCRISQSEYSLKLKKVIDSLPITIAMQSNKIFWSHQINLHKSHLQEPEVRPMQENKPEVQRRIENELSNELIEIGQIERNSLQLIWLHWNLILHHPDS